MTTRRTNRPFADALSELLAERGWSQRTLAERVGVSQSHVNRLVRQADSRLRPSLDLMRRISAVLDVDEGFFREAREAAVLEALRADPTFRDATYDRLRRMRAGRRSRP